MCAGGGDGAPTGSTRHGSQPEQREKVQIVVHGEGWSQHQSWQMVAAGAGDGEGALYGGSGVCGGGDGVHSDASRHDEPAESSPPIAQ